jgi:hypothetical protein
MMAAKSTRSHFTEAEAAETLGVSTEKLRELVRRYIPLSEEDLANLPSTYYQRSDLLLLQFLAEHPPGSHQG